LPEPTVEPNSIAILPFSDLSAEGDQAYFSDGIAEELLNLLVRVDGLKVASRTSSFAFKGQNRNIPEIAAELKVANILEGSVRKAGNRVRITAQLIDTRDDRHLWSDTFDRELVDIFAIQDEIATAIVDALKDQLGVQAASDTIVVKAATGNLDAYDLYLKGRNLFIARQNLDEAIGLFQRAIELDPNYARAWEGLAATERVADDWLLDDGIDHNPLAIEAARRALELDPGLSMPYAVLAGRGMNPSPETGIDDLSEAERLLGLAIEKDPNNTTAWLWRGIHFNGLGYFDRAVADFNECLDRDPAYLNCVQYRAAALVFRGETDAGLAAFIPTVFENFHSMSDAFVPVLVERGNSFAAVLLATTKIRLPYAPTGEWIKALEHPDQDHRAGLAHFDRWAAEYHHDYAEDAPGILLAFGAYERAVRYPQLHWVLFSSASKAFRKTEYFKQFVHDLGIEDYWRKHGFPPMCRELGGQDFTCD
jgi:TolB-like protein